MMIGLSLGLTATGSAVPPSSPSAPLINSVIITPRGGQVGDTFTATVSHSGVPSPELDYQWLNGNSPIAGATRASYTPPATVAALSVQVRAHNDLGEDTQASVSVEVVAGEEPPQLVAAQEYPTGSAIIHSVSNTLVDVEGRPEPLSEHRTFPFSFRTDNTAGKTPTIVLRGQGTIYRGTWGYAGGPVWYTDPQGDSFNHFDNWTWENPGDYTLSNNEPFPAARIYIAPMPPYTPQRYAVKIAEWLAKPLTQPTESAVTGYTIGTIPAQRDYWGLRDVPALPCYAFKIGTGPLRVGMSSGLHANEVHGDYALEGAVEWLLGDSAEAVDARGKITVYFYPNVNALGRWSGTGRITGDTKDDANRIWGTSSGAAIRAIYQNAIGIDKGIEGFSGWFDQHAWNSQRPDRRELHYNTNALVGRTNLNEAVRDAINVITPAAPFPGSFTDASILKNWVEANHMAAAYCSFLCETSNSGTPAEWRSAGIAHLQGFMARVNSGDFAANVPAGPAVPVIESVSISPLSGAVGTTFTANVTYTGSPLPQLEYQWIDDRAEIAGAVSATYTALAPSAALSVQVRVWNDHGEATMTSAPVEMTVRADYPVDQMEADAAAVISARDQAGLYVLSDPTSVYTTSEGTTQAREGDPVGLVLDKRLMGGMTAADYMAANGYTPATCPGNHLKQIDAACRPTLRADDTVREILFDGTSQYLTSTLVVPIQDTAMIIAVRDEVPGAVADESIKRTVIGNRVGNIRLYMRTFQVWKGTASSADSRVNPLTTPQVVTGRFYAAGAQFRRNGSAINALSNTASYLMPLPYIGASIAVSPAPQGPSHYFMGAIKGALAISDYLPAEAELAKLEAFVSSASKLT